MNETKRFEAVKPLMTLTNTWVTRDEIEIAQVFHVRCGGPFERVLVFCGDCINHVSEVLERLRVITQVAIVWLRNRCNGRTRPKRYSVRLARINYDFG